ncbi:AAA family ATPase [Nostoc sp.]
MSQIIAIANQKGGTGKSTTAVHLIYYLTIKKGYNTLLIDADSQTSSSQWINNLEQSIPFKVIHEKDKLFDEIPKLAKQYDYIVVDGPAGRLDDETKAILSWADLVLVPIQPKVLDLSSTLKAVLLINQAQEIREGLPKGALFLNRAKQGTRLKDEATRFLKTIPGVISLKTIIHDREVIADVPGQNITVWTMSGRPAAEARREYTQLFNEIFDLLKI